MDVKYEFIVLGSRAQLKKFDSQFPTRIFADISCCQKIPMVAS